MAKIIEMVFVLLSVFIVLTLTLFATPIFINIGEAMNFAGFALWCKVLLCASMVAVWFTISFVIMTTGFLSGMTLRDVIDGQHVRA